MSGKVERTKSNTKISLPYNSVLIPWAGACGTQSLAIPHQNSMYMVSFLSALSSKQFDYVYGFHIAYIHE